MLESRLDTALHSQHAFLPSYFFSQLCWACGICVHTCRSCVCCIFPCIFPLSAWVAACLVLTLVLRSYILSVFHFQIWLSSTNSLWAKYVSICIYVDDKSPGPVVDLRSTINQSVIRFSWDPPINLPPGKCLDAYVLRLSSYQETRALEKKETFFEVVNICPGSTISLSVKARCGGRFGPERQLLESLSRWRLHASWNEYIARYMYTCTLTQRAHLLYLFIPFDKL